MKNTLFVLFLLLCGQLIAQTEDFKRTEVVYLKNGSIFRGQLEAYEVGKAVKLRLNPNKLVIFEAKNIKKIVQEASEVEKKQTFVEQPQAAKPYNFREQGLYFLTHVGYIGGNDFSGNYSNGFNFHAQGGIQLNRLAGAGIGVGVDFYNVNLGSVLPVYATFRGYAKPANISPYYQIAAGVGFPIKNENSNFNDSKMGVYVSPEFGIRVGGSAEANMTIGLGIQWQQATYINSVNDSVVKIVDEYTFRRFNFKIGVLF